MKTFHRLRLWILLAALLVPLLTRAVSHYYWFPQARNVQTPDYASFTIPQPPVSTPHAEIITPVQNKVVVIDYQHGNQFTPNEIESFVSALAERGADVEISNGGAYMDTRLKYASAFVIFSPMVSFLDNEVNSLRRFVDAGGRLVVFTDPTRGAESYDWYSSLPISQPDVDGINPLLAPFGITIQNDYLYNLVANEGNFRNVLLDDFGRDPLTEGLDRVAFYGSHSLTTLGGTALIGGDQNTFSSLTDSAGGGQNAAVLSADGSVLALGDFSFLVPPYDTVADNQVLIERIAEFLLAGEREHQLIDFPYLFDRTISVVLTGDMQMNADLIGPLGSLQTALTPLNLSLEAGGDPDQEGGDQLVLGTLTTSQDLDPYLTPFELDLLDPDSITLPGLGKVGRSGIGLLLYQHSSNRNTLVLLTNMPEDLPLLINVLSSGYMSACMVQGGVGLCSLGPGSSYYGPENSETPLDLGEVFGEYWDVTPSPVSP